MSKPFSRRLLIFLILLGVLICAATFGLLAYFSRPVSAPAIDSVEPSSEESSAEPAPDTVSFAKLSVDLASNYIPGDTSSSYYIRVNRAQNVVMVYARDSSGSYSNLVKTFVASTGAPGSETPLGTFTISARFDSLYLVGDVWGRYAVRIEGRYYFHSVPYFSKGAPWDDLEYLEYNKLGSGASAGCVRLAVADAKWLYDNIPAGTIVEIYDSDSLPAGVTKPVATTIPESSPNRGWDPTDPASDNPWYN